MFVNWGHRVDTKQHESIIMVGCRGNSPRVVDDTYPHSRRYNETEMRTDAAVGRPTVRPNVNPWLHH